MTHNHPLSIPRRNHRLLECMVAVFLIGAVTWAQAEKPPETDHFTDHEKPVADTHAASHKPRVGNLPKTSTSKATRPPGVWGGNSTCLASLHLNEKTDKAAFEQAAAGAWRVVFSDPCTGDWKERWHLDGSIGTVATAADGMVLTAGPEFGNDAHHMVLWTKDSFEGDLRIDFDYTRLDRETRCVNILYIQATGSGKGPYHEDIMKWNHLRGTPAMSTYFNHMHAYHLSYAAFPNNEDTTAYLRGRRYMPEAKGMRGTELVPEHAPEGLFETAVPHQVTVIKNDRGLFIRIANAGKVFHAHMANPDLPKVTHGRIGLRHMFTRSARYANFSVRIPQD